MSRAWGSGSTTAWRKIRADVLDRDLMICRIQGPGCTIIATEVDHIVPKGRGGDDDPSNLRAACRTCNRRRGDGATSLQRPTVLNPTTKW